MSTFRWGLAATAAFVLMIGGAAEAQDLATARAKYNECNELFESGDACRALVACEEGLEARTFGHLQSLTDRARALCVEQTREERKKRRAERSCPEPGQVRTGGVCCWEGQTLLKDPKTGSVACSGMPTRCPSGYSVDEVAQACTEEPCADGKHRTDEGQCCWKDQVYVEAQRRCIGIPTCPAGYEADRDICAPMVPDQDDDGIADANDKCPTVAEDKDGYQDTDGCPEYDNDGDQVCDAFFTRQLGLADGSFEEIVCAGSDGCPLEAEDMDGWEDADGCPDPDNDGDGIADAKDLCPEQAGTPEFQGCVPPPDYTMAILGWSGVGSGVALLVTGTALLVSAVDDRDALNNPVLSTERSSVVTNLTEVEARELKDRIFAKETAAGVTLGLGGALLATGSVLLIFDALGAEQDGFEVSVAPTREGAFFTLGGRF